MVFILLTALPCLVAPTADPANALIKNVRLFDRQGIAENVVVNILITDGILKVVTEKEPVPCGPHA